MSPARDRADVVSRREELVGRVGRAGREFGARWERFFFKPEPTSTLAVIRIVFGLLIFAWTLSLAGDLAAFFGDSGVLPKQPEVGGVWGVLGIASSDAVVQLLFAVLLVASLALALGYHTRLAAVLVFIGVMSFERRNPYVFNTGDWLVRVMAFYLALAPSGAALSLDRWRANRSRFWEFPLRAPWALRLMQIQLSVIYIAAVWDKLQGTTWNNGTATSYVFRITDVGRFPVPGFITHSVFLSNLMTFGTLAIELSVGVLVWNRRLRPWVLLAGGLLHVGIEYSIRVGFFSLAMLTLYISFLDPGWAQARLLRLRDWIENRRAIRREAQPVASRAALSQRADASGALNTTDL
jgi:Vitamin K-dependent gamma-carboxylase